MDWKVMEKRGRGVGVCEYISNTRVSIIVYIYFKYDILLYFKCDNITMLYILSSFMQYCIKNILFENNRGGGGGVCEYISNTRVSIIVYICFKYDILLYFKCDNITMLYILSSFMQYCIKNILFEKKNRGGGSKSALDITVD